MKSALKLEGLSIIPNSVERFVPEDFTTIGKDQIEVVQKPEDAPAHNMAHKTLEQSIGYSGSYALSPFSFNWNHHSEIYTVLKIFKQWTNTIPLSSCRVDAIAKDKGLAKLITDFAGASHITCAIEGISERLCNFMQKSLTEEEFVVGMEEIIKSGFHNIKLYYIYTGLENEDDIKAFDKALNVVDQLRKKYNKPHMNIRCSFTPLLSTLGTPFQYHGSKVHRSIRSGSKTFFNLRRVASNYGIPARLSTSIGTADFSQMVEFADRRSQSLFEYISLNGIQKFPKISVTFYRGAKKVTFKDYKTLPFPNRLIIGGEYYSAEFIDRLSFDRLYLLVNNNKIYPEIDPAELTRQLLECDGKEPSADLVKEFPKNRRDKLKGTKVRVQKVDPSDYLATYWNGKKQHTILTNVFMSEPTADIIKNLLPVATGGVTFNDIIEDKSALHIFPDAVKFHSSRHIGTNFKQYIGNRASVYESYCHGGSLGKCLSCIFGGSIVKVYKEESDTPTRYMDQSSFMDHSVL